MDRNEVDFVVSVIVQDIVFPFGHLVFDPPIVVQSDVLESLIEDISMYF